MVCKHLSSYRIASCTASDELFVPSLLELMEYCRNHYEECPIYKQAENKVKKEMHVSLGKVERQKSFKVG